MTALAPIAGWALFTSVCAVPVLKGTRMLAEWLEERPDGSISKGKSNSLIPLTASALAFGALAYGFGFGGIAGIGGGATTQASALGITPNTPTVDVVVFAATADSIYWLGTPYVGGGTHDSTQVQIDSLNGDWTSSAFTDSTSSALERDTLPAYTGIALAAGDTAKARIRYKGDGVWSEWSDSATFSMRQTLETGGTPYIDFDWEAFETIADFDTTTGWTKDNGWPAADSAAGTAVTIDTTRGYNGRRHSLKYTWAQIDSSVSRTISRQIAFDSAFVEVWVEIPIRYSTNFTTDHIPVSFPDTDPAGIYPNDHKLIFGGTQDGDTYRWQVKVGMDGSTSDRTHSIAIRPAGISQPSSLRVPKAVRSAESVWGDGEWHTFRMHWRHSLAPNTGNDAFEQLWIDGDSMQARDNFNTETTDALQDYITNISLGKNKDDGPANVPISLWWGYVKVWTSDPGW